MHSKLVIKDYVVFTNSDNNMFWAEVTKNGKPVYHTLLLDSESEAIQEAKKYINEANMFSIQIRMGIGSGKTYHTGLEALDLLRKLGLPDSVECTIQTSDNYFYGMTRLETSVSESFARKYFDKTEITPLRRVSYEICGKEDVYLNEKGRVDLKPDLSPERIKELWLLS